MLFRDVLATCDYCIIHVGYSSTINKNDQKWPPGKKKPMIFGRLHWLAQPSAVPRSLESYLEGKRQKSMTQLPWHCRSQATSWCQKSMTGWILGGVTGDGIYIFESSTGNMVHMVLGYREYQGITIFDLIYTMGITLNLANASWGEPITSISPTNPQHQAHCTIGPTDPSNVPGSRDFSSPPTQCSWRFCRKVRIVSRRARFNGDVVVPPTPKIITTDTGKERLTFEVNNGWSLDDIFLSMQFVGRWLMLFWIVEDGWAHVCCLLMRP